MSNPYVPESRSRSKRKFLKTPELMDVSDYETLTPEKNFILPKIISLASRLVPVVAETVEGGNGVLKSPPGKMPPSQLSLNCSYDEYDEITPYKKALEESDTNTRVLTTPDLKIGTLCGDDLESGTRRPASVARAATTPMQNNDWGLAPVSPFSSQKLPAVTPKANISRYHDNPPDSAQDSIESFAAELDLEYQLKQREADELLASIQKSHLQSKRRFNGSSSSFFDTPSSTSLAQQYHDEDTLDISDDYSDMNDDDDLNMEIDRLNDVAETLRTEMRDIQLDSLPVFVSPDPSRTNHLRRRWRFPELPVSLFGSSSSSSLSPSAERALELKTFRTYFGSSGLDHRNGDLEEEYISQQSLRALYWAIAMVWAVVILLAGHFELKGLRTWGDILDWISQSGL